MSRMGEVTSMLARVVIVVIAAVSWTAPASAETPVLPDPACLQRLLERSDPLFDPSDPLPSPIPCPPDQELADRGPLPRVLLPLEYPPEATAARIEGDCFATFDVRVDGSVDPDTIAVECTQPLFTDYAVRAASQGVYFPAQEGGRPVARHDVVTRIEFRLPDE